jgi:hypothetical protein
MPQFLDKSRDSDPDPEEEAYQSLEPALQIFLSNNSLSSLPSSTWSVHSLAVLSVRNNCLTSIPGSISQLVNLRELNLSNNRLRWLPWELLSLLGPGKSLKAFFVSNNPLYKGVDMSDILQSKRDWAFPLSRDSFQLALEASAKGAKSGSESSVWLLKLMKSFWNLIDGNEEDPDQDTTLWEPLAHNTIHVASTEVSLYYKDNSPSRPSPGHPLPPSSLPSNVTHIKASPNPAFKSPPPYVTCAPTLLELAIKSCAGHPGVNISEMISYLSPDTPEPLLRALRAADQAQSEGGRVCNVCKRNYIIPRTEWIEFWHWVPENAKVINEDEMFWPFLRRGCSEVCVPYVFM